MANYTTADIKALRERTGAGMMDVKKALDEADGDQEKALEIIRIKGAKSIAKRAARATSDGLVAISVSEDGKTGTMIELNSETDFVAKSPVFVELSEKVLAAAVEAATTDVEKLKAFSLGGETVQELIDAQSATIGEKLVLRRVSIVTGDKVAAYLHRTNKDLPPQVGVLVATDAAGESVARDIAMHIAAYSPTYLTRDEVPADLVESERHVAEETARSEGKPEQALPKIIEGRMTGFYKSVVLLDQPYARDSKIAVGKVLEEAGGHVTGFARFRVGE